MHRACKLGSPDTIPRKRDIDWDALANVRADCIQEELDEYKEGVANKDVPNIIQELCDLLYVVYGAAVVLGVDLEPFFEEIQRANMEKAGGPKREDGKQLKPAGWRPPDLIRVYERVYGGRPH
jgi:predicted HAD superfamily Cof-like phosphohydrolase